MESAPTTQRSYCSSGSSGSSGSSSSSGILILILIWRAQLGESYELLGELSKQLDELG